MKKTNRTVGYKKSLTSFGSFLKISLEKAGPLKTFGDFTAGAILSDILSWYSKTLNSEQGFLYKNCILYEKSYLRKTLKIKEAAQDKWLKKFEEYGLLRVANGGKYPNGKSSKTMSRFVEVDIKFIYCVFKKKRIEDIQSKTDKELVEELLNPKKFFKLNKDKNSALQYFDNIVGAAMFDNLISWQNTAEKNNTLFKYKYESWLMCESFQSLIDLRIGQYLHSKWIKKFKSLGLIDVARGKKYPNREKSQVTVNFYEIDFRQCYKVFHNIQDQEIRIKNIAAKKTAQKVKKKQKILRRPLKIGPAEFLKCNLKERKKWLDEAGINYEL